MAKLRFLIAEWKNLLMLNYEVDPEILKPYLPAFYRTGTFGRVRFWLAW